MTTDVNIQLINFPNPGKEMVVPNDDGSFTILINSRISHEEQLKAYQHAMRHIKSGDFQKDDTQKIEAQAHEIVQRAEPIKTVPAKQFEAQIRRLRRERAKIRRQLQERERFVGFLMEIGVTNDDFFAVAEDRWLYGEL